MIEIIGKHIRKNIFSEVQKDKYYSVIADEVADIGNKEQLLINFGSLCFKQLCEGSIPRLCSA